MSGFAVAMLLAPMLNDSVWRAVAATTASWTRSGVSGLFLAAVPVLYVLVWWGAPLLGVGYPILVALAILVDADMRQHGDGLPHCHGSSARRRGLLDVWPAVLVSLALALLEIWLAGLLRYGLVALAAAYLVD